MSFRKIKQKLASRGSAVKLEAASSSATQPDSLNGDAHKPSDATPFDQPVQSVQTTPRHVEPPVPPVVTDNAASICELWDVAYRNLREEDEALVLDFERKFCGDLHVGLGSILGARVLGRREQMEAVLRRKVDQISQETWRLRFGTTEVMIKDLAQPVLGIINSVNGYVNGALASNPYASLAWAGVTLLLPLLLNPSEQAASLAKGLEHISGLISQSRMWEELYVRCYESKTKSAPDTSGGDSSTGLRSHLEYKTQLEKLYRKILKFQITSYCYYSSSFQIGRDVVKWNGWDKLLDDIREGERVFAAVSETWRDIQYHEECSAADQQHREAILRWEAMGADIGGLRRAVEGAQSETKRAKLLAWLCDIDPSEGYNAARSMHKEGTGDWLIKNSEQFRAWEVESSSLLWLHGKVGSGKTILSSTVINFLRDRYSSDPRTALAYFYFSFSDARKQDVAGMLASLVKQLCARRPLLPHLVETFYEYEERGERPDAKKLEAALLAAMEGFSMVHIVIDALDECPRLNNERERLLDTLGRICKSAPTNLHLFCTSRKEVDIDATLGLLLSPPRRTAINLVSAEKKVVQDIAIYIDSILASSDFGSWPNDLKTEAREAMIERADGMFQYVAHQFDVLRKLSSETSIREAIRELPVGLDATYDRLLQSIDPDVQPQVARSLMWLAFSTEPLTLGELAEIFILRQEGPVTADKTAMLFKPGDVLKYFSGLVLAQGSSGLSFSQREGGPTVRLAHFSIKEYLISPRITKGSAARFGFSEVDAHLHIARLCIAYHLQSSTPRESRDNSKHDGDYLNLRYYAARNWPLHLEMVPRGGWPTELADAASDALAARSKSLRQMLNKHPRRGLADPWVPSADFSRSTWPYRMLRLSLFFTARRGFVKLTELLLSSHEYLVQEDLDAALADAAYGGSTAVVNLLLDRAMPANINAASDVFGDALRAAASAGHVETVQRLLDRGADIDAQRGRFGSALQAACAMGRLDVVGLLVDRGAKAEVSPNNSGGVLTSAIESGSSSVLRLLLDSGAHTEIGGNTNDAKGDETPLHAAARNLRRYLASFNLLLERGADVNARGGGEHGYPLQALCSNRPAGVGDLNLRAVVELLLEKGAEINAPGGKYGGALQCACHYHNTDNDDLNVVKLLLDRGADANARGGYFGTPFQAACTSYSFQSIGRLLVEKGADVHAQGGYYGNALQASCHNGNADAVEWLLDLGVNINASGGEYGSTLQAAAASTLHNRQILNRALRELGGRKNNSSKPRENYGTEVLRRLLRRGAEINQQGGRYGTALQAAAFQGHVDKVRLLLDHGADVNAKGGEYGTALQAACCSPDDEVALLLLEHGADVHAQGGPFGSAWHAAATQCEGMIVGWVENKWKRWKRVLQLMLDRGVDINDARGRQHATALQAALESQWPDGKIKIRRVRFLLDRGADVNVRAGQYGFPLQSACCCVKEGTHGADSDLTSGPIEFLLLNCPDIDVNAEGGIFGSALQAAAYHGQTTGAKALLRHGANVEIRGGKYRSALNAAVIQGFWDVVEVLLAAGATPDSRQLARPDEKWLELVREADGQGAVDRYRLFWDKHKRSEAPRRADRLRWLYALMGAIIGVLLWSSL